MNMTELVSQCDTVAGLMKTLAHPDRLRILCALAFKDRTVSEIVAATKLSQSQTSQYLNRMKLEKILMSNKVGTSVRYAILDPKVYDLIQALHTIFCKPDSTGGQQ